MNILHVSPSYTPAYIYGGPTLSVSQLCEAQASIEANIAVFTTTANGPEELPMQIGMPLLVNGVAVTYFRRYTGDHTHLAPGLWWAVWRECRKVDAVHIHSWWSFPVLGAVFICWLRGVRPVLSPRGTLQPVALQTNRSSLKQVLHQWIGQWLLQQTKLHATSSSEAGALAKLFPDTPCEVIDNLIKLPPRPAVPWEKIREATVLQLLFLSRIHPIKGLPLVLEALALVDFPWTLTVAGSGDADYVAELQTQAGRHGLADKIQWIGKVEEPEKWKILTAHDVLVLTSHSENFANVVIESLAVGTAVLISDQVGIKDYVLSKELGWVSTLSPENIAQHLTQIWNAKPRLTQIRLQAPSVIQQDFNPQTIARKYLHYYQV